MNASERLFVRAHRALYRLSGGRIGASLAGLEHLLLTTTGRKSGAARQQPLACFLDGADWVVVASKGGADSHPDWYLNLRDQPQVEIQIGASRERRRARTASPAERERLWPELKRRNPAFARYEQRTEREIPLVILERTPS